jgi:hypothetical protein
MRAGGGGVFGSLIDRTDPRILEGALSSSLTWSDQPFSELACQDSMQESRRRWAVLNESETCPQSPSSRPTKARRYKDSRLELLIVRLRVSSTRPE